MSTIRRVGVLSVAKVFGMLYGLLGLILGALFTCMSLLGAAAAFNQGGGGEAFGVLFGLGAIILMPLFYGIVGFITGLVTAFLYNLIAGWVGGIEVETG